MKVAGEFSPRSEQWHEVKPSHRCQRIEARGVVQRYVRFLSQYVFAPTPAPNPPPAASKDDETSLTDDFRVGGEIPERTATKLGISAHPETLGTDSSLIVRGPYVLTCYRCQADEKLRVASRL